MCVFLEIKYGERTELYRVKTTLAKMDWYNKFGYNPKLPKNIDENSSEKELKEQIAKEFDEEKYKTISRDINSNFSKITAKLSETLNAYFKNVPKSINVYLTVYGVGGSYHLPNRVVLNINGSKRISGPNIVKILVHEIVHLCVERDVLKYNIKQWEKERVVDLILNSKEFGFLKCNLWQNNYHGAEKYVDSLFNKYFFKDQDKFYSELNRHR